MQENQINKQKTQFEQAFNALKGQSDALINIQQVMKNVKGIQEICNTQYADSVFYGNSALNKMTLRDPEIATLLTTDVLKYIFNQDVTIARGLKAEKVYLRDVIKYGCLEGLESLKYMTSNEHNMSPKIYENQKKDFEANTKKIINNISKASGVTIDTKVEEPNTTNLLNQFEVICKAIDKIPRDKYFKTLIPNLDSTNLEKEVHHGLIRLIESTYAKSIKDGSVHEETMQIKLEELAQRFLGKNEALLDASIIHQFYDRAHIETALKFDFPLVFKAEAGEIEHSFKGVGNKGVGYKGVKHSYRTLFQAMVTELCANPTKYPIAVEQFATRFNLVEMHLEENFSIDLQNAKSEVKDSNELSINIKGQQDMYKELIDAIKFDKNKQKLQDVANELIDDIKFDENKQKLLDVVNKLDFVKLHINPNQRQEFQTQLDTLQEALKGNDKNNIADATEKMIEYITTNRYMRFAGLPVFGDSLRDLWDKLCSFLEQRGTINKPANKTYVKKLTQARTKFKSSQEI